MRISELTTPALLVERDLLDANLATMSAALPGPRLRPHVKAHKTTALARRQQASGHSGFTCATVRECEVMAAAGLGADLLLANEVLDARRLGSLVADGARVTTAVDSPETVAAAAGGGVREVLVDVNVGLNRCGCPPERAGELAAAARSAGLEVRGVMGYEGHLQLVSDPEERKRRTGEAMALLQAAAADVGGEVVSAGGTGTYRDNIWATEIQAGSYALMDTAYDAVGHPFGQALSVLGTVVSVSAGHAVADVGLKALGMDHGLPSIDGAQVRRCADEHTTFVRDEPVRVGERVRVLPAHVDPTVALHERMHLVDGDTVLETWPVDMRGW
ncbi:alanine racemase [Pseudonocardia sp. MH-G8]|uniref:alanine racemase n=1 Tax=Pseudonocardia sp. MH-G8 TaxID=1854588 RepID=UPI000BA055D9|nr:alanine racemase [Pseudonocardia sp. MH-G8]OZM82748.1 metal-activated pyridoxal enzyme [Pseudonocardia sp. MH-G8]